MATADVAEQPPALARQAGKHAQVAAGGTRGRPARDPYPGPGHAEEVTCKYIDLLGQSTVVDYRCLAEDVRATPHRQPRTDSCPEPIQTLDISTTATTALIM